MQLLRQWSTNITYFANGTSTPSADELQAFRTRGIAHALIAYSEPENVR